MEYLPLHLDPSPESDDYYLAAKTIFGIFSTQLALGETYVPDFRPYNIMARTPEITPSNVMSTIGIIDTRERTLDGAHNRAIEVWACLKDYNLTPPQFAEIAENILKSTMTGILHAVPGTKKASEIVDFYRYLVEQLSREPQRIIKMEPVATHTFIKGIASEVAAEAAAAA